MLVKYWTSKALTDLYVCTILDDCTSSCLKYFATTQSEHRQTTPVDSIHSTNSIFTGFFSMTLLISVSTVGGRLSSVNGPTHQHTMSFTNMKNMDDCSETSLCNRSLKSLIKNHYAMESDKHSPMCSQLLPKLLFPTGTLLSHHQQLAMTSVLQGWFKLFEHYLYSECTRDVDCY